MATSHDFIEYVCEQIQGVGDVRHRKMFGEYMVYVNSKPVLLVCDNTVYVKIIPELDKLCAGCEKGAPYKGAKEHYMIDIDDTEHVARIIEVLEPITPIPKPKKKAPR